MSESLFGDLAALLADFISGPRGKTQETVALERLDRLFTAISSRLETTWDIEVIEAQVVHMLVTDTGSMAVSGVVGASARFITDELSQTLGREVFIATHDRKVAVTRYREAAGWRGGAEVFELPDEEWLLLLAAQDSESLSSLSTLVREAIDEIY